MPEGGTGRTELRRTKEPTWKDASRAYRGQAARKASQCSTMRVAWPSVKWVMQVSSL